MELCEGCQQTEENCKCGLNLEPEAIDDDFRLMDELEQRHELETIARRGRVELDEDAA